MTSPLCLAREALKEGDIVYLRATYVGPKPFWGSPGFRVRFEGMPHAGWVGVTEEALVSIASSPPAEIEEGVREAMGALQAADAFWDAKSEPVELDEMTVIRKVKRALAACAQSQSLAAMVAESAQRPVPDETLCAAPLFIAALSRGEAGATCKQSLQVHPEAGAPSRSGWSDDQVRAAVASVFKRHCGESDERAAMLANFTANTLHRDYIAGAPSREEIANLLQEMLDNGPSVNVAPGSDEQSFNEGANTGWDAAIEHIESVLSLFSPQSLKASEKKEDHIARAVPLSTISEGWRPIETAPKDGTVVLLGRLGKDAVFSGWWQDGTEPCGGNGPGWIDGATDRDEDYIVYAGITHFMPLPAPPALSEGWPDDRSDDQPA